jgi:hypothetical protein
MENSIKNIIWFIQIHGYAIRAIQCPSCHGMDRMLLVMPVMARSSSQLAANTCTINAYVCLPICLCISVCTYVCLCLLMFATCLCTSVCADVFLCLLMLLMYAYVCLSVCLWVMTSVKEFSVGTMKHGRKGSV